MIKGGESAHDHGHAFSGLNPREPEGLVVSSRRNMLKAGMAGLAGLSLPDLIRCRAQASDAGRPTSGNKAVILLWMTGGPSQIDTWDPKPDRPFRTGDPSASSRRGCPASSICEHLPKQAAMLDRFTIIRSVDARHSNHEPNRVFQTGNLDAAPRINPNGEMYPAIGSIVAKHHGAKSTRHPALRGVPDVADHIAFGGYLGQRYDPFIANRAARLARLYERRRGHRPHHRGRLLPPAAEA